MLGRIPRAFDIVNLIIIKVHKENVSKISINNAFTIKWLLCEVLTLWLRNLNRIDSDRRKLMNRKIRESNGRQ